MSDTQTQRTAVDIHKALEDAILDTMRDLHLYGRPGAKNSRVALREYRALNGRARKAFPTFAKYLRQCKPDQEHLYFQTCNALALTAELCDRDQWDCIGDIERAVRDALRSLGTSGRIAATQCPTFQELSYMRDDGGLVLHTMRGSDHYRIEYVNAHELTAPEFSANIEGGLTFDAMGIAASMPWGMLPESKSWRGRSFKLDDEPTYQLSEVPENGTTIMIDMRKAAELLVCDPKTVKSAMESAGVKPTIGAHGNSLAYPLSDVVHVFRAKGKSRKRDWIEATTKLLREFPRNDEIAESRGNTLPTH